MQQKDGVCFLKKNNKVGKTLAKLTKKQSKKIQLIKLNIKGAITIDIKGIQSIKRTYSKNSYSIKLENLKKWIILYTYTTYYQIKISNLSRSMTTNKIEKIIKSTQTIKGTESNECNTELYQTFKEELMPKLLKLLHKREATGTLSSSFYKNIVP